MGETDTEQNRTEPYRTWASLPRRRVMFRREGMFVIAEVPWELHDWGKACFFCHGQW